MWSRAIEGGTTLHRMMRNSSTCNIKQRPKEWLWECHLGARRSYRDEQGKFRVLEEPEDPSVAGEQWGVGGGWVIRDEVGEAGGARSHKPCRLAGTSDLILKSLGP